jgi:hypothetical protein
MVIGSVLAGAWLCELAVRWYPRAFGFHPPPEHYMPHVFTRDEAITWTLRPGAQSRHEHLAGDFDVTVTIDERGFRANPYDESRPNLLILGDSYTFGFGVEDAETFPRQLAVQMPGWNVLNAGYTGGMSLDTQFVWLRRHHDRFRPAVVLFQVFAANDFLEMAANAWEAVDAAGLPVRIRTSYYVDRQRPLLRYHRPGPLGRVTPWLRQHSHLAALIMDRLGARPAPLPRSDAALTPQDEALLTRVRLLVDGVLAHSRAHGYRVGFVFVPRTFLRHAQGVQFPKVVAFKQHLQQRGIPHLTLEQLWDEEYEKVHFPNDCHYTAYGNTLVARLVHEWLGGWLPAAGAPPGPGGAGASSLSAAR